MDVCVGQLLQTAGQQEVPIAAKAYIDNMVVQCRLRDLERVYAWIVQYGEPLGLDFKFREGAPSKLHVWDSGWLPQAQHFFGKSGEWKISAGDAEHGQKWSLAEAEEEKEAAGCVKLVGVYFGNNTAVHNCRQSFKISTKGPGSCLRRWDRKRGSSSTRRVW